MMHIHNTMQEHRGKIIENAISQALTKTQDTTVSPPYIPSTSSWNVNYASPTYDSYQTSSWPTAHPTISHTPHINPHLAYISQYVTGAGISSFIKGVIRVSTLASPLRVTIPTQLTCTDFPPKQIMTWSECHVVMSWWHKGFQMITFMSALKGYKRRIHERVGAPVSNSRVPSLKFGVHRAKLTPQEYFGTSQHWVSQEFLHSS